MHHHPGQDRAVAAMKKPSWQTTPDLDPNLLNPGGLQNVFWIAAASFSLRLACSSPAVVSTKQA